MDKKEPHVVVAENGERTHYLGQVEMTMNQPKAPKPASDKQQEPKHDV